VPIKIDDGFMTLEIHGCLLGDDQGVAGLGVGQAMGNQPEYLGLPAGERAEHGGGGGSMRGRRAKSAINRRVTDGASTAAATRTAWTSSAAVAS